MELLTRNDIAKKLGVSIHTLIRWQNAGSFPKPIALPGHSVRWEAATIEEWLKERTCHT